MSLERLNRLEILHDRASMRARVDDFFLKKNVLWVDCPALSPQGSVDLYIDLIEASVLGQRYYLHSSPEYGMKKLLSEGIGDIYHLGYVFRDGERGERHQPEFCMAEWYRKGFNLSQMMEETFDFIRLFLGPLSAEKMTYQEALSLYAALDYTKETKESLLEYIQKNLPPYPSMEEDSFDDLLTYIFNEKVEPHLGLGQLTAISYFPPNQCALSKVGLYEGLLVSYRFEVYYQATELANGYDECLEAGMLLDRFKRANQRRVALGKKEIELDEIFIEAHRRGIEPYCGVAVGFDRLMMLRLGIKELSKVRP